MHSFPHPKRVVRDPLDQARGVLAADRDAFDGFFETWWPRVDRWVDLHVAGANERRQTKQAIFERLIVELREFEETVFLDRFVFLVVREEVGKARAPVKVPASGLRSA